mgnify:CR=1 FL=1
MKELDDVLSRMDLDFLGSGQHAMGIEGFVKAIGDDNCFIIDVRTDKELEYVSLPFATHIPLAELPARKDEIPKDKQIIVYCSTIFRAAVAYTYLLANGFPKVKGVPVSMEEIVSVFKPKPLMKM